MHWSLEFSTRTYEEENINYITNYSTTFHCLIFQNDILLVIEYIEIYCNENQPRNP